MSVRELLHFLAMLIPTFLLLGLAALTLAFSPDGPGTLGSLFELSVDIQRNLFMVVVEEPVVGPH